MRLVVFAPGNRTSAIGRVGALVSRALVEEGHQVDIVLTEEWDNPNEPRHDFGADIRHWSATPQVEAVLAVADMAIYHIGDNYHLHRGCLEWMPRAKGVVCLHDFFLANLFWGWSNGRRDAARALIEHWYGRRPADEFFKYEDPASFVEGTHLTSPMTEWIAEMAEAVVTHSRWGIDRVLSACPGPVRVVPLPYEARAAKPGAQQLAVSSTGKEVLLTVGHINRNKRPESIILAIANSPILRDQLAYQLIGAIESGFADELSILARRAGVALDIRGAVDDDALDAAISQAQIMGCLRRPALEAASASTIEAMLHGKPVIVMNAGFYQDIPDDCAIKIACKSEVADLRSALERLHQDPALRQELGARARQWAERTFLASNYARELVEAVRDVLAARPATSMLRYFVGTAARWSEAPAAIMNADTIEPIQVFESAAS